MVLKIIAFVFISIVFSGCNIFLFGNMKVIGAVEEYLTGSPIPQAQVQASYIGWGWRDGNLVWDKEHIYEASTNSQGKFELSMPKVNSVHLTVTKNGYSTNKTWQEDKKDIVIKLQPNSGSVPTLQYDTLEIGFENGIPYGWNFADRQKTTDINQADLWPAKTGNSQLFTINALGNGGIASVSAKELGVTQNLLQYTDLAPEEGYQTSISLILNNPSDPLVYFVRTRDGMNYAKFEFNLSSLGTIGSEDDREQGTWGILLNYVYNPDKSRDLTFRP